MAEWTSEAQWGHPVGRWCMTWQKHTTWSEIQTNQHNYFSLLPPDEVSLAYIRHGFKSAVLNCLAYQFGFPHFLISAKTISHFKSKDRTDRLVQSEILTISLSPYQPFSHCCIFHCLDRFHFLSFIGFLLAYLRLTFSTFSLNQDTSDKYAVMYSILLCPVDCDLSTVMGGK